MPTFVPLSFAGNLPEYFYQTDTTDVDNKLEIKSGNKIWRIQIDTADNDKLKFSYSLDNGATFTLKAELNVS